MSIHYFCFMIELIIIVFIIIGGFTLLGNLLGKLFFPKKNKQNTYVDKITHIHHHYHDNRSINIDKETFKKLKD